MTWGNGLVGSPASVSENGALVGMRVGVLLSARSSPVEGVITKISPLEKGRLCTVLLDVIEDTEKDYTVYDVDGNSLGVCSSILTDPLPRTEEEDRIVTHARFVKKPPCGIHATIEIHCWSIENKETEK